MDNKRNTIQRQLIFDAVEELGIHPTAEQVFGHVAGKCPSISKATVYRNLNQMAESGELLNIGVFNGSSHYDCNCYSHYHFVCDECKQVFDINDYFPDICARIKNMEGFDISSHNISFSGLCRVCNKTKKPS